MPRNTLPSWLKRTALPLSASATKQHYREMLKKRTERQWKKSPRYNRICQYDNSLPSNKFIKETQNTRRSETATIYQLRTGHIPLAKYLHRIGKAETPRCPHCNEHDETVHHYLIRCQAHERWRVKMTQEGGIRTSSQQALLGDKEMYPHLIKFIKRTRKFKTILGGIPQPHENTRGTS